MEFIRPIWLNEMSKILDVVQIAFAISQLRKNFAKTSEYFNDFRLNQDKFMRWFTETASIMLLERWNVVGVSFDLDASLDVCVYISCNTCNIPSDIFIDDNRNLLSIYYLIWIHVSSFTVRELLNLKMIKSS